VQQRLKRWSKNALFAKERLYSIRVSHSVKTRSESGGILNGFGVNFLQSVPVKY